MHLDVTTRGNWTKLMFCGRLPVLRCPMCHAGLMDFFVGLGRCLCLVSFVVGFNSMTYFSGSLFSVTSSANYNELRYIYFLKHVSIMKSILLQVIMKPM